MESPQLYYSHHGPMTAIARDSDFRSLPKELPALVEVVQGLLIHRDIAPFAYHIAPLSEPRRDEAHIRPAAAMLAQIRKLDPRPLPVARDLNHRFACVCRHYSVMLASMLREQGVPARARCGFGAYFNKGKFEDHWVAEYWNAEQSRWIMVDAQLDGAQRKLFNPDFDPLDVPRDRFIIAGDAWQMCRRGAADPDAFGLTHVKLKGLWFVAGNLLRDLASLNRMELLPWDVWGLMSMDDSGLTGEIKTLLDRVAALTIANDRAFPDVRALYDSDARLRVPATVFNALRNAPEPIAT